MCHCCCSFNASGIDELMTDVAVLGLFFCRVLTHQLEITSGADQITAHIQTVIISVPEIWIRDPLVPCLRVCDGVEHCRGTAWRNRANHRMTRQEKEVGKAQRVRTRTSEPDPLSSLSEPTWCKQRTSPWKLSSDLNFHAVTHSHKTGCGGGELSQWKGC